jgi:hypothetical protein
VLPLARRRLLCAAASLPLPLEDWSRPCALARCASAAAAARQGVAPPPLEARLGFLREQRRPLPRVEAERGEGSGLRELAAGDASSEGGPGRVGVGGARETATGRDAS